jgi:hypothetical protein
MRTALLQVERALSDACDTWAFEAWSLQAVTEGHALSSLAFALVFRAGLHTRLGINLRALSRCRQGCRQAGS